MRIIRIDLNSTFGVDKPKSELILIHSDYKFDSDGIGLIFKRFSTNGMVWNRSDWFGMNSYRKLSPGLSQQTRYVTAP